MMPYVKLVQGKTVHFTGKEIVKCDECGKTFTRGNSLWHECFEDETFDMRGQ